MAKNAFIFTEDSNLHIRKPNGLRYEFDNVDKPNLGFDFDVVIYDDEEFKILNYDDSKSFDNQERTPLEDSDRDSIERYIENSEAPNGINLNNQTVDDLYNHVQNQIEDMARKWRFSNLGEVVYAGREGSNHPFRSNARRVLEFADSCNVVLDQTAGEINATREDHLKTIEEYMTYFPDVFMPESLQ